MPCVSGSILPPPQWSELVKSYDTYGSTSCNLGFRANLLIDPSSQEAMVDSNIFTASVVIPVGISHDSILQGQMNFDESNVLDFVGCQTI